MAKVAIKNENITSFGGIYHIMDVFSKLGFEKLTESVLGKRGSSGKAFSHGSIFGSLSSFTALNVAKIMCKELGTSIGRLKAKMINAYYAQRIIDVFEKSPNTPLNKERINDIFSFADDAV